MRQRRCHPAGIFHFRVIIHVFEQPLKGNRQLPDLVVAADRLKPVFLITALVFLDFFTGMAHPADGARDTVGNENTCLADENQRRDRADYQIALLL